jgi:peptidoglycan/LPS O-acetylase OafA/YrhL
MQESVAPSIAEGDLEPQCIFAASKAARTVACALVVLVHVNIFTRAGLETWWPAGFLFAPFFAVPVPTFFILSGFFVGRFAHNIRRPGILQFLRKKLKILIVPFFVWNFILLLLSGKSLLFPFGSAIYYLLTGVWQLYYVFVLIQLLLLHFLVEPCFKERPNLFLGLSACVSVLFYVFGEYMLWTRGARSYFVETQLVKTLLPWIIFFAFGVWLRSRMSFFRWLVERLYGIILVTAIAHALYYWELRLEDNWVGFNPIQQFLLGGLPYRLLAPLLLLVVLFRLENLSSRLMQRVFTRLASTSKYTYGIYLSHTAFVIIFSKVLRISGNPWGYWIEPPILFVSVWLSSLVVLRGVGQFKMRWIGRLLYGSVPKRNQLSGDFL